MELKRRSFVKLAAMAAATTAAGGALTNAAAAAKSDVSWDKAPCRFCGTGCQLQVGTQGGRVVAVASDKDADVNKGLLCVKGYHVGLALYGRDRLTQPLLKRGDEQVPIPWDEAIDMAAQRINRNPAGFAARDRV